MPDYSTPKRMDHLANVHRYHAPKNDQLQRYDDLRSGSLHLATLIEKHCPPSVEKDEAHRLLTLVHMSANAAIAINEDERPVSQAPPGAVSGA